MQCRSKQSHSSKLEWRLCHRRLVFGRENFMGVARTFRGWVRSRGRIAQNNGHYAIQGHSRSPVLLPIVSTYATSCVWIIVTYVLPCTFPSYDRLFVQFSLSQGGASVYAIVPDASHEFSIANLVSRNEKRPFIVWCKAYFDTLNR